MRYVNGRVRLRTPHVVCIACAFTTSITHHPTRQQDVQANQASNNSREVSRPFIRSIHDTANKTASDIPVASQSVHLSLSVCPSVCTHSSYSARAIRQRQRENEKFTATISLAITTVHTLFNKLVPRCLVQSQAT